MCHANVCCLAIVRGSVPWLVNESRQVLHRIIPSPPDVVVHLRHSPDAARHTSTECKSCTIISSNTFYGNLFDFLSRCVTNWLQPNWSRRMLANTNIIFISHFCDVFVGAAELQWKRKAELKKKKVFSLNMNHAVHSDQSEASSWVIIQFAPFYVWAEENVND